MAFALADGQDALVSAGARIDSISVVGGGARSRCGGRIPASVLGRTLRDHAGSAVGPAFGAARLARLAVTGENPSVVCVPAPVSHVVEPGPDLVDACGNRRAVFRRQYDALKPELARGPPV